MKRLKLRSYHFVLFSLVIHGLFTLGVLFRSITPRETKPERVEFEIVETQAAAATKSKPIERAAKAKDNSRRIVDQSEERLNDEKPADTKFLSRHDQVVHKQTVAKNHGEFKNRASKDQESGNQGNGSDIQKPLDLKPTFDIAKSVEERIQKEQAYEKAAADGFLPPIDSKKSAMIDPPGAAGKKGGDVSQSLDYIKGIDPGLETLLSTKEFVYYTYFNRIRNQLNQYWSAKVRLKLSEMYKKGRMIASSDDKITKCLVTLDQSGRLIRVQIIGDSGVRELDEAAVESFNSAAPFPNPPSGMVDSDGTIKIRWDFILEA